MVSNSLFFSLLTSVLLSCSMAMASPNQTWTTTSYIRKSCSHTLYPGLCYTSLLPYTNRVGSNPVLLARFAMNVTMSRLKTLSVCIASIRHQAALSPSYFSNGTKAMLKECSGLISDAMDLVKKSEKEVTGLEGMVGAQVIWRISNAQTWLSAAITDEDTCTDEFDRGGGSIGEDAEFVCKKLKRAQQLTSNALALINCLVNS